MHYDYVVTLKRDNAQKTDLVSILLIFFSLGSFCYVQIRNGLSAFLCIISVILIVGLFVNGYKRRAGEIVQFRYLLLGAGIGWLAMPFLQWMILPFSVLVFLESQAKYPLEIAFYQDGVVLNVFFKKRFTWDSLESVILKDGLLTLDFKNNKLIQKEVLDDDEPDAPEDEFNAYCKAKLLNSH